MDQIDPERLAIAARERAKATAKTAARTPAEKEAARKYMREWRARNPDKAAEHARNSRRKQYPEG